MWAGSGVGVGVAIVVCCLLVVSSLLCGWSGEIKVEGGKGQYLVISTGSKMT